MMRRFALFLLIMILAGCNLQSPTATHTESPAATLSDGSRLVVAWVDSGNLMVWQTGDTLPRRVSSGGVVRPLIAPDGGHVVFTRGPSGAPETLWSVDVNGTAEQEIVGERPRSYTPGDMQIGDVAWLDDVVLYFNTVARSGPAALPRNDLYRANIRTREVALILPAGEGGRFAISPDGEWIVVAYPGTYGRQDGRLAVLDPLAVREPRSLLFFVGIATGSERSFYPPIYWLSDSSAVLTAIPDSDLVYHDTADDTALPLTRVWKLPIGTPSDRELIGSMRISFFGQPRWSDDGSMMTFLRRATGTNDFTAYVADQSGEADQALFAGGAETIEQPVWIPGSTAFYYARANPDGTFVYYTGSMGTEARRLSQEIVVLPIFVSSDAYVYAAPGSGRIDMRFAHIGEESQYLGSAGSSVPVFDAVLVQ